MTPLKNTDMVAQPPNDSTPMTIEEAILAEIEATVPPADRVSSYQFGHAHGLALASRIITRHLHSLSEEDAIRAAMLADGCDEVEITVDSMESYRPAVRAIISMIRKDK